MKRYIHASANEAIVIEENSKSVVASQVALNIKGEWDAIEGYQKLMPFLSTMEIVMLLIRLGRLFLTS